jgi:enamine deaminase RidA (YjgF/YER057c/UK114 family)
VTAPRRRIGSGGPWEERYAYSRAVAVGDDCWVAGTTDAGADGRSLHPGDPGAQARAALERIGTALEAAGFSLDDVVRVRAFVTDPGHIPAVGESFAGVFARARPAATAVVVAGLIDPSLLVEIEADARRG